MDNETSTTLSPHQSDIAPWERRMLAISLSVIIVISFVGNLIVVVVFFTYKPLRKFANMFMVSLAISDMLVGALGMPTWIVNIICDCAHNKVLRTVWICMDIVSGVASILNLTAVSVCRYVQITKPYKYTEIVTKRRVIASLIAIWIFGGIMAMLKGIIPRNTDRWYYQPGYQVLIFLVSFALPMTGISYCYFHMFKEVSRQQHQLPTVKAQQQQNRLATDIKAIKTIAIVIVMFVICWCPFFVVVLVNGFCKCVSNEHLITFVKVMHYSNSALNPIIYVWYNNQYRKAFITAVTKFAHHHGAEFVVAFLNNKAKGNEKKGKDEEMGKIVLLRS